MTDVPVNWAVRFGVVTDAALVFKPTTVYGAGVTFDSMSLLTVDALDALDTSLDLFGGFVGAADTNPYPGFFLQPDDLLGPLVFELDLVGSPTNSFFMAYEFDAGARALAELTDVAVADVAEGQFLKFSAGQWTPGDADVTGKQDIAEKGQPGGYAGLDTSGKVPVAQLPVSAGGGGLSYLGLWNATTNSPTIPAATSGNTGVYYKVSVAGTTAIDGVSDWAVGDWIISNGASWDKIDNSEIVISVAGKVGAVTLAKGDVGLGNVDNTADANKPVSTAQAAAISLKVDTTYVNTALAAKADISYVDTGLAAKADQTAVTTSLALKADTTYVDAGLADKADADATTAALTLKADTTYVDAGLADKADQSAMVTALATKADATTVTAALALKAATTYVDAGLAAKADTSVVTTALALKAATTYVDAGLAAKADQTAVDTALAAKADTTYVDAGLADKADTSAVDTALATKADATTVTAALALKAATTYVDAGLAAKADASTVTAALALKAATTYVDTGLAAKADTSAVNTALALKADSAAMTTALAAKADTTYVDTGLAAKADTSAVTTSLALKADTTYVDTGLAAKADAAATTTALAGKQAVAEKGQANGYASLDADGKVPAGQLTAVTMVGGLAYQGVWNATTNSPAIVAAVEGNTGWYYKVSVAGTTAIDGLSDWAVGDWIISNGSAWDKIDNSETVTSVAGRVGAVTLAKGDVGLSAVDNTADADKPVSTAQATAIALKADSSAMTTALAAKADTTYVDTGLAAKADTSAVTTSLALKADTSAVNTALATKADQSAVNTALAAKADAAAVTTSLALKLDVSAKASSGEAAAGIDNIKYMTAAATAAAITGAGGVTIGQVKKIAKRYARMFGS